MAQTQAKARRPRQQQTPAGALTALAPLEAKLSSSIAAKFNRQRVVSLEWQAERRYAMAIMLANETTQRYALDNPDSLINAMLDVARLGTTLSPALGLCYLIPRKVNDVPVVHAVPSYKGLEQIALRGGQVTLIQTELVYSNDTFKRGVGPSGAYVEWEAARGDRGELEYGFCCAWYANGRMHAEIMSREELDACKEAAARANGGEPPPSWRGKFIGELYKKCVVRRASKHWPTDQHMKIALEIMDRAEPMDFSDDRDIPQGSAEPAVCVNEKDIDEIKAALVDVPEGQRDRWVKGMVNAMGFTDLYDMPVARKAEAIERLVKRMQQWSARKPQADPKPEQEGTDGQG